LIEKRTHLSTAGRVFEFPQGFGFNLPNPLASNRELLADLFERVIGVHADPEAHPEHALLARGQ
jgi:hypothetical protein